MGGNRGYASLHSGHPWPSPCGQRSLCKYAPGVLVPLHILQKKSAPAGFFCACKFCAVRWVATEATPRYTQSIRGLRPAGSVRCANTLPAYWSCSIFYKRSQLRLAFLFRLGFVPLSGREGRFFCRALLESRHPRECGGLVSSVAKASAFAGLAGNLALALRRRRFTRSLRGGRLPGLSSLCYNAAR